MKQIVILIDQLHSVGGIERLVALKANYWSDVFGYSVTLISTEQQNKTFAYPLSKNVSFIDLKIDFDRTSSYFGSRNLFKFLANIWKLKKELRKIQPDFILVASHIPITYCINFFKGKAKTIKEFHFTKFNDPAGLRGKLEDQMYKQYDFLAVLSTEEENFFRSNNTIVLPNPVESQPLLRDKDQEIKKKAIFMGRLAPVKNLEAMIEIWSLFHKKHSDWFLEIYGDYSDPYALSIKAKVESLDLSDTIIFKGRTKDVLQAINTAQIMLLTSHQECFPLVILESLSQGVPVFSFDCPTGPRNILSDGYDGRLIENKNVEEFAIALNKFADSKSTQSHWRENALLTAQKYSIQNIMDLWNTKIFSK